MKINIFLSTFVDKYKGIARMSRRLSTLLRNLAKGSSDRIPLREELSLLRDYDDIQQVRYMGMYEIEYDVQDDMMDILIQKFTLQPLVENAIFHGIEPTGRYGTIRIEAAVSGDDLLVSVTDDGTGIRNIDDRIKLVYGDGYGLSFESRKNEYTKVTARIKAER